MNYFILMIINAALTAVIMPFYIKYLKTRRVGQTTREEGPLWHQVKSGTPTMGGAVFICVASFIMLTVNWVATLDSVIIWMISMTLLLFACIGFLDDYLSIFRQRNEGLTARQKFLAQLAFSILVILIGYFGGLELKIPVGFTELKALPVILVFAMIWLTGFSNAVNLTDGLDGLAGGLSVIAYTAYGVLGYFDGVQLVAISCACVVGGLLGFLIYNKKPAKIFMGDVGSLALGAGLALIAMILNRPWSLLVIGGVFVIETASVILQVSYFKLTGGKRIFRMTPIHHHFEMSGWSENKIVRNFWALGVILAVTYLCWSQWF